MKKIPTKYKGQGIHVYCNKCKRQVTNKCGNTGEPISKCENKESQKFKFVIHRSGINRKFTRVSEATTIQEAQEELLKFKKEITSTTSLSSGTELTLSAAIREYLQKLNCEGPYKRKSKPVTPDHITDCIRVIETFVNSLKSHRIDSDSLLLRNLEEKHTDLFLNDLDRMSFSESYYAKYIRIMRSFFSFMIDKQFYRNRNFFKDVRLSKIEFSPETISDEEFSVVLQTICFESGFGNRGDGRQINFYRPWLVSAFQIARYTGLRKEELGNLKFEDVIIEEEFPVAIQVRNYKVERLKGERKIIKAIPVLPELVAILDKISSQQKIESEYLIGEEMNRNYLMDFISRAFTHFYKVAFPDKKPINLKALRKAFITQVVIQYGPQAYTLTGQSGMQLINDHYYDPVVGAKNFSKMLQKKKNEEDKNKK